MNVIFVLALIGCANAVLDYTSEEIESGELGVGGGSKETNCSCGWTNKARIVNGRQTLQNEFPLMAGIMHVKSGQVYCGGTIITHRHILTASHCTFPMKKEKLAVVIGGHDLSNAASKNTEIIGVEYTIEHENYNTRTLFNDIALIVLSRPITFSQFVGPACLPSGRTNLVDEWVKVMGWGRTSGRGTTSNVLMKVDLKVLPIETCAQLYKRSIPTSDPFQICTYRRDRDSCQGDSGGPLIWLDPETNRYTIAAIVSYGKACASQSPAVNTDVSYFLPWIQKHISASGEQTCSKM